MYIVVSIMLGCLLVLGVLPGLGICTAHADSAWVTYEGGNGPGNGRHVVLISGDEEYRSEETMPVLGKILAARHGFKCTVLFAINKKTGDIDPETLDNIPGLEALDTADLMILFTRFRELPDDQMKHIIDYTQSGRPIIGMRTATHAFRYVKHPDNPYARYSFDSHSFEGGYGRQVLGETWVNHYGIHEKESTRGLIAPGMETNPIVQGCEDIWGASDVYALTTLTGDSTPVVMGQVLCGMASTDKPNTSKPPVPVAWCKTYTGTQGKPARVFTTTMGHSRDFTNEGFRRLLINACYWGVGIENQIPPRSNAELTELYTPIEIGVGKHRKGIKPSTFALPVQAGEKP